MSKDKLIIHPLANKNVHFEFNAGNEQTEIEVYIGGWFLCSVDIKDVSEEAKEYLFDKYGYIDDIFKYEGE